MEEGPLIITIGADPGDTTGVFAKSSDGDEFETQGATKAACIELCMWLTETVRTEDGTSNVVRLMFERPSDGNPSSWSALGYMLGFLDSEVLGYECSDTTIAGNFMDAASVKAILPSIKKERPDLKRVKDRHLLDAIAVHAVATRREQAPES